MSRWLNLAHRLAQRSNHPRFKMAAVVVCGGRVISQACNTGTPGHHCEARALRGLNVPGATVYVARFGLLPMSRPCLKCQHAMLIAGIEKFVYFDENGIAQEELVCNLPCFRVLPTTGTRRPIYSTWYEKPTDLLR